MVFGERQEDEDFANAGVDEPERGFGTTGLKDDGGVIGRDSQGGSHAEDEKRKRRWWGRS